jgi:hypothetical protein
VALGPQLARRMTGQCGWVVAVVGDGALTEGMLLEALNHASSEGSLALIVVLNDNGYAISPGFGAPQLPSVPPLGVTTADTVFAGLGYLHTGPSMVTNCQRCVTRSKKRRAEAGSGSG